MKVINIIIVKTYILLVKLFKPLIFNLYYFDFQGEIMKLKYHSFILKINIEASYKTDKMNGIQIKTLRNDLFNDVTNKLEKEMFNILNKNGENND